MKPTITAYCWASGLIESGSTLPEGALPIVTGSEKQVREEVEVWSVMLITAICWFRVFPRPKVWMHTGRRWSGSLA